MVWQRSQVHVHTSVFLGEYGGGNGGYKKRRQLFGTGILMFFKSLKVKQSMNLCINGISNPKQEYPGPFLCRCFLKISPFFSLLTTSIDPLVLSREELIYNCESDIVKLMVASTTVVDHQFVDLFQSESGSMMTFPWAPSFQKWPNGEICLDQIQHNIQISHSL